MSLFTHKPTVQLLEGWCRTHMGRHDSPEYLRYRRRMVELYQQKTEELTSIHDNEGGYGMSGAGSCLRAAHLRRQGVKGVEPEGSTRCTWEHGHNIETQIVALLEMVGFHVDGAQARVRTYASDGTVLHSSMVDGIITAAPPGVDLPLPCILSCKSTAYKMAPPPRRGQRQERRAFAALPIAGIAATETSWYLQAQLEMHGMEALAASDVYPRHVLVVAMAKDVIMAYSADSILQESGSLAFYAEVIPYQERIARTVVAAYEKGAGRPGVPVLTEDGLTYKVLPAPGDISQGWGGPNKEVTKRFNPCFSCDYRHTCSTGVA